MDWAGAMPIAGLTGGLLIGLAGAVILLGLGRIAGVSGMVGRATGITSTGAPWATAAAFIIGLPLGAGLIALLSGPIVTRFPGSTAALVIGGLVVGFGTRMGSGCTSGHGVCGLSRLSPRSIAATVTFMVAGFTTVFLLRLAGVTW
ncbi:YeeE/YedE family protein [soil metagenome]